VASSLVVVTATDARPRTLTYFRQQAAQLAALWGGAVVVEADTGRQLEAAVASHDLIGRLAFVCHGGAAWLRGSRSGIRVGVHEPPGVVSLDHFASVLAPRARRDIHVALAACWCAADRWQPVMTPGSWGPGGARSLAGRLYAALVPLAPWACVIAHASKGRATENPCLRAWGGPYGAPSGGVGASVLDHHLGPGAHKSAAMRALWRQLCDAGPEHREPVEELLAGLPPTGW